MEREGWGRVPDLAGYSNLGVRTIRKLFKLGLPYSKLPTGAILVKFSDFDDFVKGFEVQDNTVNDVVSEVCKEMRI